MLCWWSRCTLNALHYLPAQPTALTPPRAAVALAVAPHEHPHLLRSDSQALSALTFRNAAPRHASSSRRSVARTASCETSLTVAKRLTSENYYHHAYAAALLPSDVRHPPHPPVQRCCRPALHGVLPGCTRQPTPYASIHICGYRPPQQRPTSPLLRPNPLHTAAAAAAVAIAPPIPRSLPCPSPPFTSLPRVLSPQDQASYGCCCCCWCCCGSDTLTRRASSCSTSCGSLR